MSSRTKSFFEQNHNTKARPASWNKGNNIRPPLGDSTNITAPPKLSIPPTSQAKAKLQAFALVKGGDDRPRASVEAKENAAPTTLSQSNADTGESPHHARGETTTESAQQDRSSGPVAHKTPALPHAHTFPCTPGARLSLEDLIGDDEIRQPLVKEASPEEQLTWVPNSSSSNLTPNRKRKRAKSSSPSCPQSSSQRGPGLAFEGIGAGQETPEADPATDLWQRLYGSRNMAASALKLPDLGPLAFQASPRPLETPIKSSGLRRWASTGNDWPNNQGKKRRTNEVSKLSLLQENGVGSGGRSKVAAWVEKIQGDLAQQKLTEPRLVSETIQHSSTSPLPVTGNRNADSRSCDASPTEAQHSVVPLQAQDVQISTNVAIETSMPPPEVPQRTISAPARPVQGSESRSNPPAAGHYGAEAINAAPLHLRSKAPLPAFKRPSITRPPIVVPPPVAIVPRSMPAVMEDDFGDDMDLTNEDFEELMSQAPKHQASAPITQAIAPCAVAHPELPVEDEYGAIDDDVAAAAVAFEDDDDDEFGGYDLDEESFMAAESQATQGNRASLLPLRMDLSRSPPSSQVHATQQNHRRFVVKKVIDAEYANDRGRQCPEKVLLAEEDRSKRTVTISLRGSWYSTAVSAGHTVHLACLPGQSHRPQPALGQLLVDDADDSPLLIVHPDHMLSATTVADSFDCIRKAVLQDRIKATGETSKAMVYGSILHEIFQQALSANRWDDASLTDLVQKTLLAHIEGLWELGMQDLTLAFEDVKAKMGELSAWAKVFVAQQPGAHALVKDRQGEKSWMSVNKLIAIEEHVWSPQYGLKGNIDATIEAAVTDDPRAPNKTHVVPFEVKTGRTTQSAAHRAQTALYTLLLSDRYDVAVKSGILYYLESSDMTRIAPPANEIRQMIQQRNRLAAYIHSAKYPITSSQDQTKGLSQEIGPSGMPPMLRVSHKCGRCYAQQSCFTYHALVENGTSETAGMLDDGKKNHALIWSEAVGHLLSSAATPHTAVLKTWFTKWNRLLTFEESEMSRFRKELWTMSSKEREATGRCFGDLVVVRDVSATAAAAVSTLVDGIEGTGGKINRFTYTFAKPERFKKGSFTEGTQLIVGEPVVVSSEQGQWALANGYVTAVGKNRVTIAVDRKLGDARSRREDFDPASKQTFQGIMSVGADRDTAHSTMPATRYRLDKDEFSNGLATIRNNLVTLMSSHPLHTKLRNLVVLDQAPQFVAKSTCTPQSRRSQHLGTMNADQTAAIQHVLSAQDYSLILGMPGTGKTTTIAHLIRALLAQKKSILLTSYTHTAVDNILLKIQDIAPPGSILRLGVPAKINPQVKEFCHLANTPKSSIQEVEELYMGVSIVATTCMSTSHSLFTRRVFDICIVDEASQISLPTCLGPLLHAHRFVLVGDHFQLPPLVQNRKALEGGLDISLFRTLSEKQPESVVSLGKQYRMCAEIMALSNILIYSGKLECGTPEVASRTLILPSYSFGLRTLHPPGSTCTRLSDTQACWLESLVSPSSKVRFANTDPLGALAQESTSNTSAVATKTLSNALESRVAISLVSAFLACGLPAKEVGIITPFRSQVSLIRRELGTAGLSGVDVDSADRFQGRDKEVIILSFVRSNPQYEVGELLRDWRRINVALTRARSKLVILGSRKTLSADGLLKKLLGLVEEQQGCMELPADLGDEGVVCCGTVAIAGSAVSAMTPKTTAGPRTSQRSPTKRSPAKGTPVKVLRASQSAGNRVLSSSGQSGKVRTPGKVVTGVKGKLARLREEVAWDIFEDLTGEDL
ncbi:DNA replication endonuclease-helicase Dna2 [Oleoguttula sp. CCFEE 5521]